MTESATPSESQKSLSEPMCNLHMRIPAAARRQAKLAAVASGIPFRAFVSRLLFNAKPISAESVEDSGNASATFGTAPLAAVPVVDCVRDVG